MAKKKTPDGPTALKVVSVKMPPGLKLRMDIHCARSQRNIQDFVAEAVEELLKKRGG